MNVPIDFDHIGFLTEDIDRDAAIFEQLFGSMTWSAKIADPLQGVVALFGRTRDGLVYELLQPLSEKSPITRSLKTRTNVLNHLCFRCNDLATEAMRLRAQGFRPITEPTPAAAFAGNLIQFFYHSNGMLLELIEGTAGPFHTAPGAGDGGRPRA
ncbi:MAG: VOC family protein [Gammaproteobacteria bacterium]